MPRYLACILPICLALLAACSSSAGSKPAARVAATPLVAQATATPSPTPFPSPSPTPNPSPVPTPSPSPIPATHTLTGTLSAPDCNGGYALVGAAVLVRNEAGQIIGSDTALVSGGQAALEHVRLGKDFGFATPCTVTFQTVVPDAKFYQVTIGTHGGPAYSFAQMQAMNWTLALSLN